MTASTQKITVTAFLEMDFEEETYYELIDGEIVKKASPAFRHQNTSAKLFNLLFSFVDQSQIGKVIAAPMDVILDETALVQPDLLFIRRERLDIIDWDGPVNGAPDLVVEIISPSSVLRDRVDKYVLYERTGVKEYWLVDPNNTAVMVYALADGRYALHSAAAIEGTVQSRVLEEFEVDIKTLFV